MERLRAIVGAVISALARAWRYWMEDIGKRGTIGKVASIGVGLFVLCCVCSIGYGAVRGTGQAIGLVPANTATPAPTSTVAPTLTPVPTSTAVPTDTPAPTSTPEPSATSLPTDTPGPTNTHEPTSTPAPTAPPEPTATPMPPPEPIVLSGRGQSVTEPFRLPSPVSRLVLQHKGRRNFIVTVFAGDRSDLITNKIGAYQGSRLLFGNSEMYLEIQADGEWTATIEPIGRDDVHGTLFEGKGDAVSQLFAPTKEGAVPFGFMHNGKRNFIVQLHCAGGDDVVQNTIGAVEGAAVVRFSQGPCLWEVQADGEWSVQPK